MNENLPEGWKIIDLSEAVFFQEGPGIRKWQFTTEGIKLINVGNIVNGSLNLDKTDRHCSNDEVEEKYSHFLLEENDIIMATSGVTWGKTAIVKKQHLPLMLNTSVIRFRSLDKNILSRGYLLLFLNSIYFKKQIERLITGGCQPNFGPSHLKKVKMILPPLETQNKIVEILENAEKLKEWRTEADELANNYLNALFLDIFSNYWEKSEKDLNDHVFFQEGPGIRKWQFTTEGIKLINVRNIVNGELKLDNTDRHCSNDEVEERYSHFLLEENDIVMATSGVTWGKTAIVEKQHLPLMLNTSVIRFRSLDESFLCRNYLFYFLNSVYFKKQIERLITGGCQPNFGPYHLKKIKMMIPPIEKQKRFSEIVDIIETLKTHQAQSKQEIDNLFNTLMQKAFKGELVC
ncbi:MAG: restriction endonuclease subunit S [Methanobacteriaceae archaeon]|nr:restriction endonuclease subunit S [Methanobacteriaceae archaeon]MDP2837248.1 restriction endonuclease subunit S [Methanobacteriaceae archaeon]MDP3484905.1 restriction endonuclease subunit S [Methanobacteriaceae archaeon]